MTLLEAVRTTDHADTVEEVRTLPPGSEIAPGYAVIQHVSRGEALDVYEVWSHDRYCSCMAKIIRPERRAVGRVRRRLVLEGELLTRLVHPHIVRGYDLVTDPDPVVVLETIPAETLEEHLDEASRPLAVRDLCYLGIHLSSALHYLHSAGYLHLDVKPANVISHRGAVKLIDLSLARRPGPVPRGFGTSEYLAPEQARGDAVTAAADVWGIGVPFMRRRPETCRSRRRMRRRKGSWREARTSSCGAGRRP